MTTLRLRMFASGLILAMVLACDDGAVITPGPDPKPSDSAPVFLDITSRVTSGGERGLLGLAFHPDYAANGYFYVNYTSGGQTIISRWQVSASDSNKADPSSERVMLTIAQPEANHNGGCLVFGVDGELYVSVGDGGGAGDPYSNGQNKATLLGSILRLDVNQNMDAAPYYGIPADNPFINNVSGYREEIFAYGMRNPWRMSFDPVAGRLWAGDVGQSTREEVDVVVNGGNYGWDCREGTIAYAGDRSSFCDTASAASLVDPVWDYPRGQGYSVTGGYVYRGTALSGVVGDYVFADYGSGRIWALSYDGAIVSNHRELIATGFHVSSLGVGETDSLYVLDYGGRVLQLVESEPSPGTLTYSLSEPWSKYSFIHPVDLQNAGDGSNRLFVVEQAGRVLVLDEAGN